MTIEEINKLNDIADLINAFKMLKDNLILYYNSEISMNRIEIYFGKEKSYTTSYQTLIVEFPDSFIDGLIKLIEAELEVQKEILFNYVIVEKIPKDKAEIEKC